MLKKNKHRKTIIKIAMQGEVFGVDRTTDIPAPCNSMSCINCRFNCINCFDGRKAWLNSKCEEPKRVFTEEQKNVLRTFDKIKYIARDKNGNLWGYVYEPQKGQNCWYSNDVAFSTCFTNVVSIEFPQIKWEDKEPTSREEILGE